MATLRGLEPRSPDRQSSVIPIYHRAKCITHGLQIPSHHYVKGVIQTVMAEAQGFEPWEPCGSLVFKTSAFSLTRPHFRTLERVRRIELLSSAWKAVTLPLCYTRIVLVSTEELNLTAV